MGTPFQSVASSRSFGSESLDWDAVMPESDSRLAVRMSVESACRIADRVADEMAVGVAPDLWFSLFERQGLVEIRDVVLALQLTSADFYLRSREIAKSPDFDNYVSSTEWLVNHLVLSQHLEAGGCSEKQSLSWHQDYGEFIQWLRQQDVDSSDFWPNVDLRVGNGAYYGPRLNPIIVMGLDMQGLLKMVGKPVRLPSTAELEGTGFEVSSTNQLRVSYLTGRSAGISLLVRDGVLDAVFLYFNGKDTYGSFQNALEGGVSASSSRRQVKKLLGPSSVMTGPNIVCEVDGVRRRYEFSAWLGRLQMVVLSQAANY